MPKATCTRGGAVLALAMVALCSTVLHQGVRAEWKPGEGISAEVVALENALIDAEEAALRETVHYIESRLKDRCANLDRCTRGRCSATTNGPWDQAPGQCSMGFGVFNYCAGCGGTFGRRLNFDESYVR